MHVITKLMFLALKTAVLVESMIVVGTIYHVPETLFVVPGLLTAILAVLGFLRILNPDH